MEILEVQCPRCRTKVIISVDDLAIYNKDMTAKFIEQKKYKCAKCEAECISKLRRVEDAGRNEPRSEPNKSEPDEPRSNSGSVPDFGNDGND